MMENNCVPENIRIKKLQYLNGKAATGNSVQMRAQQSQD